MINKHLVLKPMKKKEQTCICLLNLCRLHDLYFAINFIKDNLIAIYIHMKEQQKRKIQQFHPEIEDGTDLRRWPLLLIAFTIHTAPDM